MKIIRVYRPDEDRQIEALLLLLRSTVSAGAEVRRPPAGCAEPIPDYDSSRQ